MPSIECLWLCTHEWLTLSGSMALAESYNVNHSLLCYAAVSTHTQVFLLLLLLVDWKSVDTNSVGVLS